MVGLPKEIIEQIEAKKLKTKLSEYESSVAATYEVPGLPCQEHIQLAVLRDKFV